MEREQLDKLLNSLRVDGIYREVAVAALDIAILSHRVAADPGKDWHAETAKALADFSRKLRTAVELSAHAPHVIAQSEPTD